MKKIVDNFDKSLIPNLPRAVFQGRIEVVVSENAAKRAVKYLMKCPVLGFDTETRPSFKQGIQHKVALLQVASRDICFLFRLNHMGFPKCLVTLLEDTTITKVGLSWHDDLRSLSQRKQFHAGTFVELQNVAAQIGINDKSLQKLYANIFGEKISKAQRLSNWETDNLSEAQKQYAATDAWACVMLYEEIERMKKEGYELITTEYEENHTTQG